MISRLALIAALLSSGCRTREASDHERPRARREHREARHAPAPTTAEAPAPRPEGAVLAAALLGHQAASQLAVVACRGLEPSAGLDACPLDPEAVGHRVVDANVASVRIAKVDRVRRRLEKAVQEVALVEERVLRRLEPADVDHREHDAVDRAESEAAMS